ncbi:hypothetical protein ABEB36_005739 [Hypothenemus hampei]|uniref:Uncharacterized protein n=1 Tax=Hypothenemus hampei TaxID=57062 RepID=A0ABD1F1W6_HYPHA
MQRNVHSSKFCTALPLNNHASNSTTMMTKLTALGLGNDTFDYNEFILNLEAVVEETQQVALFAIETTIDWAQHFAKVLAVLGVQKNTEQINAIQSSSFQAFESVRHEAFEKNVDVSSCVSMAIENMYTESQTAITQISDKLTELYMTFYNLTTVTYIDPAQDNLEKSYTVRKRIYQCPFNFTDFTPFYVCLTLAAVLEDIVILNDFAIQFNDTATQVGDLLIEYEQAIVYHKNNNIDEFNSTAQSIYDDKFLPCVSNLSYQP